MYSRLIKRRLLEAQQDTPVTLPARPRQAGKTTLVKQISVAQGIGLKQACCYITLPKLCHSVKTFGHYRYRLYGADRLM